MLVRATLVPLMLLAAACGGNGPDDPLTGSWSNATCFGDTSQPADIQSCKLTISLERDLTVIVKDSRQSLPATAVNPRCTAIRTMTGLRYSTNSAGTLTFTGTTSSTLVRKDCANMADNLAETADTRDSVSAGSTGYSITDTTLSVSSGQLSGDYLRE